MISSKTASTLIETLIAMVIIVVWITWVYKIYFESQKLSVTTNNRIKAIAIAREWIETTQNIRDTNWLIYWADLKNCWNSFNYDFLCIWDNVWVHKIWTWNYIVYKDTDNRWKLYDKWVSWTYKDTLYRQAYEVKLDSDWLFTQSWWIQTIKPLFTRQINISYPENEKMLVKSIVSWSDSSSPNFHSITLENILTNWKRN